MSSHSLACQTIPVLGSTRILGHFAISGAYQEKHELSKHPGFVMAGSRRWPTKRSDSSEDRRLESAHRRIHQHYRQDHERDGCGTQEECPEEEKEEPEEVV